MKTIALSKPKEHSHQLRHRIYKYRQSYMLIAPYVLLFILFTVIPVLTAIALSFTSFDMVNSPTFVGMDNYLRLFLEDDVFVIAVKNTLAFAFITGPISYFLSLVLAWFINELSPKFRALMTLIFYAPSIVGNAYVIWTFIFSSDRYGLLNGLLMNIGVFQEPTRWLTDEKYILTVIIIVQLWMSLGAGFLSFIAGLQSVDRSLYESGAIDGIKNRWQELWHITLPSMKPQLMFGAVMQIASSFSVSDVSSSLAGFPSTNYAGHTIVLHAQDVGTVRYEMGYSAAISVVLFLSMIIVKSVISRILKEE